MKIDNSKDALSQLGRSQTFTLALIILFMQLVSSIGRLPLAHL
jgi:hypothetical protein